MIADDLSGAADCAVSCAVQGLRTVVQLSETSSSEPAQVLAIDAATRSMSADRAAATVERIVARYEHAPGRVLFKKLDSLLRGHIGPELAAMRCGRTPAVIVMAPALPAQGRTTIDGLPVAERPAIGERGCAKDAGSRRTHVRTNQSCSGSRSAAATGGEDGRARAPARRPGLRC